VSQATANGWMAISKDFLTEVLGAGQDAGVAGLPAEAAAVLRLMCPGLETAGNAPANAADQAIKPASIVKA
jgi:hypothetical protein